jgi:hypothetical protein
MIDVYICCDGVVPLHSPPLKKRQPGMSVHEPGHEQTQKKPKGKKQGPAMHFCNFSLGMGNVTSAATLPQLASLRQKQLLCHQPLVQDLAVLKFVPQKPLVFFIAFADPSDKILESTADAAFSNDLVE